MAQSTVKVAAGLVRGGPVGGAVVFRGIWYAAALPGAGIPADECLSLGVWAPGRAAGGVPVLVWVGSGWFASGAGSPPEAARRGEVAIGHVSLRAAAGGYASSCAVST